jgi:hypothetical protein
LPDAAVRLFVVACKGCQRTLVTIERIRDPEIAILEDHLRACAASSPLAEAPMLGEIMNRVSVRGKV